MKEVTIYWNTSNLNPKELPEIKRLIRERFNIPNYTTVNGETSFNIREEDMELLQETANRGFIQIRNKSQ